MGGRRLFGAAGFAGLVVFLLWTATAHQVTGPNLNVLWAWPTHLAAAVALGRGGVGCRWRVYLGAAAAVTALVALAWTALPQTLPAPLFPSPCSSPSGPACGRPPRRPGVRS